MARGFGTGEILRRYYGTVDYSNLVNKKQKWKVFGKGIMSVSVQTFTKCAVHVPEKVKDGNGM